MLYDFSKMNIERTKNALEGNYDTHNNKIHDMLIINLPLIFRTMKNVKS